MTEHWHAVIGTRLDETHVHLRATQPLPSASEARSHIIDTLRCIAADVPSLAQVVADLDRRPAENCRCLLATSAMAVISCAGDTIDDCRKTIDARADEMIRAFHMKEALKAEMSALASIAAPASLADLLAGIDALESLMKEAGQEADDDPHPPTGFYL